MAAVAKKRKAEEEEEEEEEEEPESWTADVMMQKAWLMRVPNDLAAKVATLRPQTRQGERPAHKSRKKSGELPRMEEAPMRQALANSHCTVRAFATSVQVAAC